MYIIKYIGCNNIEEKLPKDGNYMRKLKKELIEILLDLESYKDEANLREYEIDATRIKRISQKFMEIYNQIHFPNKFNLELKLYVKQG